MELPELLAPAGDVESLRAAVANGADAVYLGGKLFSARQYARNFDEKELEQSIRYAHRRNVKVYVTVNILLDNTELQAAAEYLQFLYNAGTDAIIIQDIGLLYLARQVVPDLKIHASTQMTIHNLPGARFLSQEGVQRIVLARELSLKDIMGIHQGSSIELEVFVHGALCISYSGQCLMSSLIGGRSGNRGRCAQPCRLPYRLVDDTGKLATRTEKVGDYLLSPRDLCTLDLIPELVKSGVTAFKFEGRMKKPEYVATVIRVYRQALDRYLQDPGGFSVSTEEKQQLEQVFNRDFTTGYFLGNQGRELMSWKRPNNRGVYLGRVLSLNPAKVSVKVRLELPLSRGDGVEYWVTRGGRTGVAIDHIVLDGKEVDKAPAGSVVE
ncbi:MAG TPA: U32 family peptidase, partial [Clostridia bacterium]|nr:U32 family peptidase [Clostridia bacterium]